MMNKCSMCGIKECCGASYELDIEKLEKIIKLQDETLKFYADKKSWARRGNSIYKSQTTIKPQDQELFHSMYAPAGQTYIGGKRARETRELVKNMRDSSE